MDGGAPPRRPAWAGRIEPVDGSSARPKDVSVLRARGELDLCIAFSFERELTEAIDAGAKSMVVDLSEATFVDSSVLAVLLRGLRRMTARGGRLVLVCDRPEIRRALQITGLDRRFEVRSQRSEAFALASS